MFLMIQEFSPLKRMAFDQISSTSANTADSEAYSPRSSLLATVVRSIGFLITSG